MEQVTHGYVDYCTTELKPGMIDRHPTDIVAGRDENERSTADERGWSSDWQ